MTTDKSALRELLETGSDATYLREMIGFAAERLVALVGRGMGARDGDPAAFAGAGPDMFFPGSGGPSRPHDARRS